MRGATECAGRLTRLMRSLRSKLGKVSRPAVGDPITQLILGVFSRDVPESKARAALDRLRKLVVDYNELRVMSPREMAEHVGDCPEVWTKCEDVSRALNRCFATQHAITLDHLKGRPRKEVREFLDDLGGLEAYSRARIRLLGLRMHALPLDEAMWAYARKTGIVDGKCSLDAAQNFLERQISDNDALEVYALLKKQAWTELGAAVRSGDVERIRSVPPDRASRNMLQPTLRRSADSLDDESETPEPEPARTIAKKPLRSTRTNRIKPKPTAKSPARLKRKKKTAATSRAPKAPTRRNKSSASGTRGKVRQTARKRRTRSA